jgi:hypothetical protein
MSSNQPPGTPDPIAAVINQVQTESKVPANAPIPLEVNLSTGQVYKADNPQDLLNKLAYAQEEATRTIRSREAENAELRTENANLKSKVTPPAPPDAAATAKANEYYQTWAANPAKATEMALAESLGVSPDKVVGLLKTAIEGQAVSSASTEFLSRCPDFPETPQNAQLIRNALVGRFGTGPGAMSADNLELVYHGLVRDGKITPNAMQPTGFTQQNHPVPNIRGGSAPPDPVNEVMAQAHTMSLEDLKKVIDRASAQLSTRR